MRRGLQLQRVATTRTLNFKSQAKLYVHNDATMKDLHKRVNQIGQLTAKAQTHLFKRQYFEALHNYKQILSIDNENIHARVNVIQIYVNHVKQGEEAIEHLKYLKEVLESRLPHDDDNERNLLQFCNDTLALIDEKK